MTDANTSVLAGADDLSIKNYSGPYEAWNFGVGKEYAFPVYRRKNLKYFTALAEHSEPHVPRAAQAGAFKSDLDPWLPTLWGAEEGVALRFWPIVVESPLKGDGAFEGLMQRLRTALDREAVSKARFRMAFPVEEQAMHQLSAPGPGEPDWFPDPAVSVDPTGKKTINVLGVIDDGIPFAHSNFRAPDGSRTRLEFCWLQSAPKEEGNTQPGVLFGKEFDRKTIEDLIRDHGEDEDALYAAAGAARDSFGSGAAIRRLVTHGAHIMDVAAGYDPNKASEPPEETRLIAVQLPNTYPWDTSSFGKDMYLLAAVHYILERAERIARGYGVDDIRVTINCSYGFSAGRHDGHSELEAAIHELVTARRKLGRPTAFVLPSGNTFQDRLHGEVTDKDLEAGEFSFRWVIQPNDRTSNYLEVWFPDGLDPKGFSISVQSPFGTVKASMDLTPDRSHQDGDPRRFEVLRAGDPPIGSPVGLICLDNHRGLGRWRVTLVVAPSEPETAGLAAGPAGEWKVTLSRSQDAPELHGPLYVWVQRDVDLEAFRKGNRQSYLKDDNYRVVDDTGGQADGDVPCSYVKRFGSMNGVAAASSSLIVSGCRPAAGTDWSRPQPVPSGYSSAGKPGAGDLVGQVDCTAPSDRSHVVPGILAAGTRSGSYALVQGTSVAAPLVARRLSEAFARCTDEQVRQAEADNYLSIIESTELQSQSVEDSARLGKFLVL